MGVSMVGESLCSTYAWWNWRNNFTSEISFKYVISPFTRIIYYYINF